MTYKEAALFFGTGYRLAKSCDFTLGAVYKWKAKGYIPIKSQCMIEALTGGKLKADLKHDGKGCINENY